MGTCPSSFKMKIKMVKLFGDIIRITCFGRNWFPPLWTMNFNEPSQLLVFFSCPCSSVSFFLAALTAHRSHCNLSFLLFCTWASEATQILFYYFAITHTQMKGINEGDHKCIRTFMVYWNLRWAVTCVAIDLSSYLSSGRIWSPTSHL